MTPDEVINNLRHAPPKIYTMAVAHAVRAYMKKTGRDSSEALETEVQTMIESIVEGFVYTFIPLLSATLQEMNAAEAEVAPPVEDDAGPAWGSDPLTQRAPPTDGRDPFTQTAPMAEGNEQHRKRY